MSKKVQERIRKLEETGIRLLDIASKTGVSLKTVYRWRNGESAPNGASRITLRHLEYEIFGDGMKTLEIPR